MSRRKGSAMRSTLAAAVAVIATVLWPLILVGVNLHIH